MADELAPIGLTCGVCGNGGPKHLHHAREMFLGTRELFEYLECGRCGSLQLHRPPNLDRYYRSRDYVPLQRRRAPRVAPLLRLIRLMDPTKSLRGPRDQRHWNYSLRLAGASRTSRILDVGCGSGDLLRTLHYHGFRYLTGIDPYTPASTDIVTILNGTLDSYPDGDLDIVMMNDSLEHVPDPLTTLLQVKARLAENGRTIVRIPIAGTFAWRTYGTQWVQLDAPRHTHVPTESGWRILVQRAGLRIVESFYDSWSFQFWGSEQYKQGIPLNDPRTPIFTQERIDQWEQHALRLNAIRDGDHATFILESHPSGLAR